MTYDPNVTYKFDKTTVLTETLRNLPLPDDIDPNLRRLSKKKKIRSLYQRFIDFILGKHPKKSTIRPVFNVIKRDNIRKDIDKEYETLPLLEQFYTITNSFAEGGQAELHQATDKHLGRPVAVKSLKAKYLDDKRERNGFIAEAKITAQLQHPGIIPIYNLCRDNANGLHLAMKLVKGHSLANYLKIIDKKMPEAKNLPLWTFKERINRRLEIFLHICDTISYAHSRGIIHCDLKPENILIGEFGAVYVMDWGIAKIIRNSRGESLVEQNIKELDGTPCFMPPEAYCGKGRDERADIFALGLILYEIVTLNRGYSGKTMEEVMVQIKYGRRNPICHKHGYAISHELIAIIDKATEYNADERYQSVDDLANDVRRHIVGLETSVYPDGLFKTIFRHFARHLLFWLIVIVLLLGGIFAFNLINHIF